MKILLVTEFFPQGKDLKFSGGVEARTYFLAKYLAKKHKVSVIASRAKNTSKIEKMQNFTIYRIGRERNYAASVGHSLSRVLFIKNAIEAGKKLDVDIVDGGNYICHFIAKEIAKFKKIPVVAWYPDIWLNDWLKNTGIYGLLGELLERINLIRGFNAYITISKTVFLKLRKYAKGPTYTIYCGVEKTEFTKTRTIKQQKTIICVSRLAKYKNINTLILAFAHLSQKIKNLKLTIVGSGPEYKNLLRLTKALNITSKVKFYSNLPRKKLMELYSSSYLFSLPSTVEGFGIATIEAAALGIPYVNSDIAIQREITKNGQGGLLFKANDALDLSKKLETLLVDKCLYRLKARQAINLAKIYDWQDIVFQTESVYKNLVEARRKL